MNLRSFGIATICLGMWGIFGVERGEKSSHPTHAGVERTFDEKLLLLARQPRRQGLGPNWMEGWIPRTLMSEARMERVLQTKLDLWPVEWTRGLARHVLKLCAQYEFDPALVLALMEVESSFRVKVRSPQGAVGLLQVMPETAVSVVKNPILKDPLIMARALEDPYLNIEIGLKYLAWLRARYRAWPPYVTFAAYNLGPSRMDVLLKRPGFRPDETWVYFKSIERRVGYYRTLELDWETTRISL